MGVYWIHPDFCSSVCLSVRPSVCRQGFRNFVKNYWLNSFHTGLAFTLIGRFSLLRFIFVFLASFLALWWPNIWLKMGFPEFFLKTMIPFITYLTFTLIGGWVCVAHHCKIENFIGYFWMRWVVIRAGVYCPHLWAQLVQSVSCILHGLLEDV